MNAKHFYFLFLKTLQLIGLVMMTFCFFAGLSGPEMRYMQYLLFFLGIGIFYTAAYFEKRSR